MFVASLATETNTFSPIRIDRSAFEDAFYAPPGSHPETPTLCSAAFVAARRQARLHGFTLIEGTASWAEPAGLVARSAYEGLRDEILYQLRDAMPVNVALFGLHGAMVAEGYDDCEGDLLARARAIVGPDAVIGIELDPHCHLTQAMTDASTVLVTFKEVPHSDFLERAEDLVALALSAARGDVRPHVTVLDCRSIANFLTSRSPGRELVDDILSMEGKNGVLSISIVHGFPAADVADVGTKVVVITDDAREKGRALAAELCTRIRAFGANRMPYMPGPEEAIDLALATKGGPVVLADRWDNPGGGVAGDSTFLLRALLERPEIAAAVGAIWDPVAVTFCLAAGSGARLSLRFGGKAAPSSGAPVDAGVEVMAVTPDHVVPFQDSRVSLGAAAAVRIGRLDVVLASKRAQTFHPEVFESLGIRLSEKKIVVVKSASHFHTAFAPIASEIIYVNCGGPYPPDPARIPYRRIRRPILPLEAAEPVWMT
ncbi:Microcystin LR degradation protein MlrC [Nitratireductor pacificus pht-3B]|uniref:Microcystinase C n=1 Tax=Nitratireductor pacificus pht-3B TaxID=391937 RepID=K2M7V2_9HYPH|nr:Microcystin LR degradation protein MlrC [Nitratireductor pacificus pht-3B]